MSKKSKVTIVFFVFALGVLSIFQNCSQVEFTKLTELEQAGISGELRSTEINAIHNENRPPIKLITILDNSHSMARILNNVRLSFNNVTDLLKGFTGDVSIYTTSQFDRAQRSVEKTELTMYTDTAGITHPYSGHISPYPNIPINFDHLTYYFLTPPWTQTRAPLPFMSIMNDSQFSVFRSSFIDSIGGITEEGSDTEEPLCILLRAIHENKNDKSFPLFLIATNENDSSSLSRCLIEKKERIHRQPQSSAGSTYDCELGEQGCNHTFSLEYKDERETLRHFKIVSQVHTESIEYKAVENAYVYPYVEYGYPTFERKMNYTAIERNKIETITGEYETYQDGDTLDPTGNIITLSHQSSAGSCAPEGTSTCTVSERTLDGKKIYADTCEYTCIDEVISTERSVVFEQDGDTAGSCSENNYALSASISCGHSTIVTNVPANDSGKELSSCSLECVDNTNYWTQYTDLTVTSCEGHTYHADCNDDQKAAAAQHSGLSISDITHCRDSCSIYMITQRHHLEANQYSCTQNQYDNYAKPACTNEDKDLVLASLNSDTITSRDQILRCKHDCSTGIQSSTGTFNEYSSPSDVLSYSSCEDTNGDYTLPCTQADIDYVGGLYAGLGETMPIGYTCSAKCETHGNAPQAPCLFETGDAKICTYNLTKIKVKSENACSSVDNLSGACQLLSSTKQGAPTTTYSDELYETVNNSLISGSSTNNVETSVINSLQSAYGDNFFLATFSHKPQGNGCDTDSDGIPNGLQGGESEGVRFKNIHDMLGGDASKTSANYSVCLPSYTPALNTLLTKVTSSIERSYTVKMLNSYEWVWYVNLIYQNGTTLKLEKTDFTANGGVIQINNNINIDGLLKLDVGIINPITN